MTSQKFTEQHPCQGGVGVEGVPGRGFLEVGQISVIITLLPLFVLRDVITDQL